MDTTTRSASVFALLSSLALASTACSPTIPAHELDATVTYDGQQYHAVLSFPERDPEAMHRSGDGSCDLISGDCGGDQPTMAKVTGDAPIEAASMTTTSDGSAIIYDVVVKRSTADEAAWNAQPMPFKISGAQCRVYEAGLGGEEPCYYTTKEMFITLSPRE